MKLEMQRQMQMAQQMKLAPHMIQSMEILQLPILALQERIEQELNSNPVLEVEHLSEENPDTPSSEAAVDTDIDHPESFSRLEDLDDSYNKFIDEPTAFQGHIRTDPVDRKLEAIKNTAAPPKSLHEHLTEQWRLLETDRPVKEAGLRIIDYINARGYLGVRLEQLHTKNNKDFTYDDLKKALKLIQTLEPPGVGARDLRECLLIQMNQIADDMSFEKQLVSNHMQQLLDNRLPEIAKKMNCSVERVNQAVKQMKKLDTSPGLQVGRSQNYPITADVIVEAIDDEGGYSVRLSDFPYHNLKLNDYYTKISKDPSTDKEARKFLQENIRSAQWIIDAVEQRKNTLLKVARAIVKHQLPFFDKGTAFLKPLPMSKIADEVGVHLATVSRAAAGKYLQCSQGLLPMRKFFSGGTEDTNGQPHSWEAVRAKLQDIVDKEDKTKPLSDDKIRRLLAEQGIENLARRTIAKYRKLLNIPAARYRKKY